MISFGNRFLVTLLPPRRCRPQRRAILQVTHGSCIHFSHPKWRCSHAYVHVLFGCSCSDSFARKVTAYDLADNTIPVRFRSILWLQGYGVLRELTTVYDHLLVHVGIRRNRPALLPELLHSKLLHET